MANKINLIRKILVKINIVKTAKKFIKAVEEHPDTDLVCVSSLLTTSMKSMKQIVETLNRYKSRYRFKIMVGGGPITEDFAQRIGADAYTTDAYAAAEAAREITVEK